MYCTCAKYRVVEYYRVCRFIDVILESKTMHILFVVVSPPIIVDIAEILLKVALSPINQIKSYIKQKNIKTLFE